MVLKQHWLYDQYLAVVVVVVAVVVGGAVVGVFASVAVALHHS